jgi:hypothetical protein
VFSRDDDSVDKTASLFNKIGKSFNSKLREKKGIWD